MADDKKFPEQEQARPGDSALMDPHPLDHMDGYVGSGKLSGKVALVTGGDSGIGRATAIAFAKEGADVAISYLSEDGDAEETFNFVEKEGRKCLAVQCDMTRERSCKDLVDQVVTGYGHIDVLVNNIGFQSPQERLEDISTEQWDKTFKTNIYSFFWTTKYALPHMVAGSSIVNTSSINGLRGNETMIDYSATKGAINAFSYALAQSLMDRNIRVNAVAPGPVWTPLIPSTFPGERVEKFGSQAPMGRAAQPDEIAPSYVFLASNEMSSYYTGEVLAPIGGETLPG